MSADGDTVAAMCLNIHVVKKIKSLVANRVKIGLSKVRNINIATK